MRWLRRSLIVLLWTAVATAALLASAIYHAQLPIAFRIVRDTVNAFVNGEIEGELAIGRLDEVSLHHIVARHVSLYDPQGRRVITADRVDLYPQFSALRGSLLRFRISRLTNGTVRMIDDGTGTPTWVAALEPSDKTPSTGEPLRAQLDRIDVVNLTIYGSYLGLSDFRVEDVQARGRLDISRSVEVKVEQATGTFVRPFPFFGRVESLKGSISSDPLRGISLDAHGHRELAPGTQVPETGEHVGAHISYRSSAPNLPQELHLTVDASELAPETLRGMGFTWIGPIAAPLRGRLEMYGPPAELALEASLETPAGAARVTGTISDAQGVSVHVASDALAIDALVPNGPALTVRGSFHISQPTPEADPHVHVALAQMRYKGFVVPAFEADGVIKDDQLHIERARSTQGGRLSLKGVVGFDGGTDLRVDANLPAVQREPNLSRYVEDLEGQLTAAVRIRVPAHGRNIDIDGKVELADARYTSLRASRITVSGTARGDPQLPQLNVEVRGYDVRVMSYSLGTARFSLRGGPRDYQAQGEFSPSEGQKTFYFDAKVAATRKQFVVQADPIEFVVGDKTFRGALRDLTIINDKQVELGLLRLASGSQRLEASGIVRMRGEDSLRAELQNFDLAAVHGLLGDRFPLSEGNADATVELRGDVARPELLVQGAMRGAKVLGIPDVGAMYFVTYKDGALELDNEVEVLGRGSLHLSGIGTLDPNIADPLAALERGRYELELASTGLDLTMIPQLREAIRSGRVTGKLDAQGTLAAPSFSGEATLQELGLHGARPFDLASKVDYDASIASSELVVRDDTGELASLTVRAELPWQRLRSDPAAALRELPAGTWELAAKSQPRSLEQLPIELPAGWRLPLEVAAELTLSRQVGRNKGSLQFTAQALQSFRDENCKLSASSRLTALVTLAGDRFDAKFEGMLDEVSVLSGRSRFEAPVEAWLAGAPSLAITRADLSAKADLADIEKVPVLCQQGRGDLHVQLELESLFTPEQRAQVDVVGSLNPHVRILEGRQRRVVESCRDDPARVWFQGKVDARQAIGVGWMEGCYGGHTDLTAFVPLDWPGVGKAPGIDDSRDIRVQVDFAESALRPLLDRTPGVLGFAATANGQLVAVANKKRVQYSGEVALSDGSLYVLATGQELREFQANLSGYGNWAKIEGLSAKTGQNGALEASGGIGFERWRPARVQLGVVLKSFPVQREGLELATLNGSAAISSEIKPDRAQTAVKLHAFSIRLPSESSRSLQTLEPHPDVQVTTEKPKEVPEQPYVFEFFIDGQRGVTATRNDFDVALATELALSYTDPVLNVGGYVEFRRGTFEVFGKEFEVNRGSLQFDGGTELNPEVNLIATQRPEGAGAARVVAQVSGTLANPIVEFYSETCPGQGAIVQLVSGRCPTDTDSTVDDATGAQNAFAAGIIGGILTLGARSQLGGLIPRIAVESTGQGANTRVKAGFEAVPKFMRGLVQRVYVQGALSTRNTSAAEGNSADNGDATPDFLIELYFPHNIVGSARVIPRSRSWGLDVTWEP